MSDIITYFRIYDSFSVCSFQGTIHSTDCGLTDESVIYNKKLLSYYKSLIQRYFFYNWRPPTLPYRLQYSTLGRLGLNHRVRDGNGCYP